MAGRRDRQQAGIQFDPLFPVDMMSILAAARPSPDPAVSRPGIAWPVAVDFRFVGNRPVVFVEYGFIPKGDVPEPLSREIWEDGVRRFKLPRLSSSGQPDPTSADYRIEFGPFTAVRDGESFGLFLPAPEPAWTAAVQHRGSCLVVLGIGMGYLADDRLGVPEGTVAFAARFGGSHPAPHLDDIPGLHVLPLTTASYHPLAPNSFVVDADVLIGVERFCLTPNRQRGRTELIRTLMLNLAYRDILPGLALAQIYQPARRTTNYGAATRAAKAIHEVMRWDRERITSHCSPCTTFHSGFLEDFAGTAAVPAMLALYAGVLRLRGLWSPGASLVERTSAFETYVGWIRSVLRVASPALIQISANLFISQDPAHRQASRLLHFRAGPVTTSTLDRLWGTAFDLFLLTVYASAVLEDTVMEPVLLTFDRGLADMFDYLRHAGIGSMLPDGGPESPQGFLMATRLELHPSLAHLGPRIDQWRREIESDARDRIRAGRALHLRAEEFAALADSEEELLLSSAESRSV